MTIPFNVFPKTYPKEMTLRPAGPLGPKGRVGLLNIRDEEDGQNAVLEVVSDSVEVAADSVC
jgi:hypothetical protein